MSKSRKKRKQPVQQQARHEAFTYVDNPLAMRVPDLTDRGGELVYIAPKVAAARSLRDDPLGQMHQRKQLGEAPYRAGRQYQATSEAEGIGRGRSSGDIREHVDGGSGPSDGLTDTRVRAAKAMAHYRMLLGKTGYPLIEAFLIKKMSVKQCALTFYGGATPANCKYAGRHIRECLTMLAKEMGLTT